MIRRGEHVPTPVQRVYAIGDVHGRYDLFRDLIGMIRRDQAGRSPASTRIILLGDIIDRGPESARLVRGCMGLAKKTDRFLVLKGNHEEMIVEALSGNLWVYESWLEFGGKATLLSWGVDPEIVEAPATPRNIRRAAKAVGSEVLDWLAKLPLQHRHGDHLFVHAGIRPGVPIREQAPDDLLWIGDEFLQSDAPHGVMVVHGHTIDENGPVFRSNRIGLDTGAYRTGRLTALGIEGNETWTLSTIAARQIVPPVNGSIARRVAAKIGQGNCKGHE